MFTRPYLKPSTGIGRGHGKRNANGGVSRALLNRTDAKMKADAQRGVISMSIREGFTVKDANTLYELIDKNYDYLPQYKWDDLGVGGYWLWSRKGEGWTRGWHMPFPDNVKTASAKRGFIKLQMYDRAGRVEA